MIAIRHTFGPRAVKAVLVLILADILAPKVGIELAVLDFVGSPVIALLAGTLVALPRLSR